MPSTFGPSGAKVSYVYKFECKGKLLLRSSCLTILDLAKLKNRLEHGEVFTYMLGDRWKFEMDLVRILRSILFLTFFADRKELRKRENQIATFILHSNCNSIRDS